MYLVPMHVPIYVDGNRHLLSNEWCRGLELLRDSLGGRFGPIAVAAPTMPVDREHTEQILVPAPDSVLLFPGFDLRCRARQYWLQHRAGWRDQLRSLVARSEVIHGGMDDVFRPIGFEGFRAAIHLGKPALFIQDTDIVIQQKQLAAHAGFLPRAKANTYAQLFERACRWGVSHAALSLLKGSALMQRYGRFARNAQEFHDTSFSEENIVSSARLEQRLAALESGRPLRLVYCGRLIERKGVDRSVRIVAAAIASGCAIDFDIIGDGPEAERLQNLAAAEGIAAHVQFFGAMPYGGALLAKLAEYDALLFTPTAEDTPRMIFDGYAAGLPLIAYDIGYVVERSEQERASVLVPRGDLIRGAQIIQELSADRGRLRMLAHRAREAAFQHSCDSWYRRRADWTFEAVDAHRHYMHLKAG